MRNVMKKCSIAALLITMLIGCSITAQAAPKNMADGTIFDAEYYAVNNPDVVQVLGTDESILYSHYVSYGKAEGRKPCADTAAVSTVTDEGASFDAAYYASNNPDVVAVLGSDAAVLYQHYVKYGKAEGRKASAGLVVTATTTESKSAEAIPADTTGSYVVNHKNGKIHINGQCPATGTGKNAMDQPVSFSTYDEAAAYSVMRAPKLKSRNCGNCW